MKFSI